MPKNSTSFDVSKHHIHLEFIVTDINNVRYSVAGILDTGAPSTEFSDQFLAHMGFIDIEDRNTKLTPGLQTQKYGTIELPSITLCGHRIRGFKVYVSRFEQSWGIDALIGLDFFRRFRVTIDYDNGVIVTSPYEIP